MIPLACNAEGPTRLTPEQFDALLPSATIRTLTRGDTLFEQGQLPQSMFWMRSGLAKVCRSTGTGRDLITELLFPGDLCGVLCSLDCHGYPVSAVCLMDSEVAVVPRDRFLEMAGEHRPLMTAATEICRGKVRFQREMMVGMAVERAEQRAARVLCMLGDRLGQRTGAGVDMPMPLSRQEFSELIGTTLETAIRVLSRFRKQGWIREKHDRMLLTNEPALRELAHS